MTMTPRLSSIAICAPPLMLSSAGSPVSAEST